MRRLIASLSLATLVASLVGVALGSQSPAPRVTLRGLKNEHVINPHRQIVFSANSRKLAASVRPTTPELESWQYVLDVETGKLGFILPKPSWQPISLSHDGSLAAAISELEIVEYDLENRTVKHRWTTPRLINHVFYTSSQTLFTQFDSAAWAASTQPKFDQLRFRREVQMHVAVPGIWSIYKDNRLQLLDHSGEIVGDMSLELKEPQARSVSILDSTPDWRFVLADCRGAWGPPDYYRIDMRSGRCDPVLACSDVNSAALSPDGAWYALIGKGPRQQPEAVLHRIIEWFRARAEGDNPSDHWNLFLVYSDSNERAHALSEVDYAKFSPDGKTLSVITSSGDLRLYDFPFAPGWRRAALPATAVGVSVILGSMILKRKRRVGTSS
jgi:hypothetical protein